MPGLPGLAWPPLAHIFLPCMSYITYILRRVACPCKRVQSRGRECCCIMTADWTIRSLWIAPSSRVVESRSLSSSCRCDCVSASTSLSLSLAMADHSSHSSAARLAGCCSRRLHSTGFLFCSPDRVTQLLASFLLQSCLSHARHGPCHLTASSSFQAS